ncbi:neocarzinostatin apoprotein domain-containing protein [Nocardia sp. NPDC058058]|uniref:neocarzinostatin apoprotein domain-containing protein n=1 Tax=Nocardia sp. NPDC058058 TaxID=3346317 RepID=UPI0036DA831E
MKTIRARSALGAVASAAVLLFAGSPAATADPALTLSASSGLAAGQVITVSLVGLPPNLPTVAVGQCKPAVVSPADCNLGGSLMGRADAQGEWQPNGGNRSITLLAAIGGTDCAATSGACTVAVTSLTDPTHILASVPLTFGAERTQAPTATTTAASKDSDDDGGNTGVVIGIAAGVVVVLAAVGFVVARRRGGTSR